MSKLSKILAEKRINAQDCTISQLTTMRFNQAPSMSTIQCIVGR